MSDTENLIAQVAFLIFLATGVTIFGMFIGEVIVRIVKLVQPVVGSVFTGWYKWISVHFLVFSGVTSSSLLLASYVLYRCYLEGVKNE